MSETTVIKKVRATSKCRGPRTWAVARERFLNGETASVICRDLDLGRANLYRRAAKEGWRKRDLPDVPPPPVETGPAGEAEPVDVRAAVRVAIGQAAMLLSKGQFARAAEAMKAAELIGRVAERLPDVVTADDRAEQAAIEDLHRKIVALCASEGGARGRP